MQTKSIIQASANVIRITKLTRGDVVKLFKDENYGDKLKFALVVDVVNDGEKTFVEFLVYKKSYSSIEPEILVLSGESNEYSIFPTSADELQTEFLQTIEGIKSKIESSKEEVSKYENMLRKTEELVSGEMSKKLTTPEFKEMTQIEYQQKKQTMIS